VAEDHPSQTSITWLGRLRRDPKDQAAVYVARSEVKEMIREESRRLEGSE
jgi:hypothetical protein